MPKYLCIYRSQNERIFVDLFECEADDEIDALRIYKEKGRLHESIHFNQANTVVIEVSEQPNLYSRIKYGVL